MAARRSTFYFLFVCFRLLVTCACNSFQIVVLLFYTGSFILMKPLQRLWNKDVAGGGGVLEKGVLRNSRGLQAEACKLRPAILLNKGLWHRCFPVKFLWRILFLTEHDCWLLLEIYLLIKRNIAYKRNTCKMKA